MERNELNLRGLVTILLLLCLPTVGAAQLISLKTVPVATGDQFMVFPSENLGMGQVSIALDDPLADPFVNPAKLSRIRGTRVFSTPTYYHITGNGGAARTLPLGALFHREDWYGGASVAVQELLNDTDRFRPSWGFREFTAVPRFVDVRRAPLLRDRSANNIYASGLVGTTLESGVSVAGSIFWAGLKAVEGVEMLYPTADHIEQYGHMVDVRVGFLQGLPGGGSVEVLLLHNRLAMTHDVSYRNWVYREDLEREVLGREIEHNLDRTNTSGIHFGYVRPVGTNGWKLGGILTVNRKSHPKIPNYELMNIPRDPGTTWAYNIGAGLSRQYNKLTFGVDLIYEPISSNTWVEAIDIIELPNGVIAPGEKTLVNDFWFSNSLLRAGIRRENRWVEVQAGLQVRTIRYWLDQQDFVAQTRRHLHEAWSEWTASIGIGVKLSDMTIRYQGRLTTGVGQPGVIAPWGGAEFARAAATDIILAPRGPLTLDAAKVLTHQLSIDIPIN